MRHWIVICFYFCSSFVLLSEAMNVGPSSVINRHSQGDIFSPIDCSAEACAAALGQLNDNSARQARFCQCQCTTERPVYREDIRQCVNTIEECSLADYVTGMQSEKVPFVFLPAQGQLINPNAEIALSDVRAEGQVVVAPVCIVSKAHFLSRSGWTPTDNSSSAGLDVELPFALARESSRTHLQWLGESWLRSLMEGRIVLVKLLCKDTANTHVGVFSPCIAFRVAGSPGLVESIRSGPVAASGGGSDDKSNKLRQADYLAIGISAGLLGMLYVAGLVGYLCYRRRRRQLENVHVKLASSGGPAAPVPGTDASEDQTDGGIIRHNPLLQSNRSMMALNMQQNNLQSSRPSSRSSQHYKEPNRHHRRASSSTAPVHADNGRYQPEMEERVRFQRQQQTAAVADALLRDSAFFYSEEEAAAAAAAMMDDRRLFFSPAYFDPDLLRQSPPPAALEFLARIRGMIDIAKDKMSSRRFMPSLIDIPEEMANYGVGSTLYGSSNRLNSSGRLGRSGSFGQPHYGTIKRVDSNGSSKRMNSLQRSQQQQQQQQEQPDELYHPVELRVNFLQKSPLPGRKATQQQAGSTQSADQYLAAVYTNPSIEEIYKSLDRSLASTSTGRNATKTMMRKRNKTPLSTEEDSDAVSDLVSEAESKLPKITTRKTYFEPDSLDRRPQSQSVSCSEDQVERAHLYQKKPQRNKAAVMATTSIDMMDNSSIAGGYNSSTCTSVQSLSRVLPAEEAMEVGNQLFNMDTGAPTLPRLGKPPSGRSNSKTSVEEEDDSHSSSGGSRVTVFEDAKAKTTTLTIQVESNPSAGLAEEEECENFEPDTLERRNSKKQPPSSVHFHRKHPHNNSSRSYMDSLERPIPVHPVKSTIQQLNSKLQTAPVSPATSSSSGVGSSLDGCGSINREELPPPGSVISLRQIYTARKQPEVHNKRPYRSLDVPLTPPPLPSKSPAPPPPRPFKPVGVHHHPTTAAVHSPVSLPPTLPPLPPKNGKSGSSSLSNLNGAVTAAAAASAPSELGQFTLGRPAKSSNVLERIARIEQESSRSGSANKGMEIALALKAKMGHLEGSLKDHKKTSTIKKTWRKLLDKVEDSFSDGGAESSGSTLRRSKAKKTKALAIASSSASRSQEDDDQSDLLDDDDQSSLGSDGTGTRHPTTTASNAADVSKLKSFYTFGEDVLKKQQQPPLSSGQRKTTEPQAAKKTSNRIYSSYQTTCLGDY